MQYLPARLHVYLDVDMPSGQTTQRTKKRLSHLLDEAAQNQPSVVLLDNLDRSMPMVDDAQERVQEEGVNSINKTLVLRDLLGAARRRGAQIFVVASAQNKQQLNKDLLSSQGRQTFDSFLEIQPPSLVGLINWGVEAHGCTVRPSLI